MGNETLLEFLGLVWVIAQLVLVVILVKLLIKLGRCARALYKRVKLYVRIKRLADKKSYTLNVKSSYFTSVFRRSSESEMEIRTPSATYSVKFFPCLKKRHTYVLNNTGGYYTISNYTPTYLVRGMLRARIPFQKLQRSAHGTSSVPTLQILDETDRKSGINIPAEGKKTNILCVHPISVDLKVVRTNRPEPVFDGERFLGYTVYSGNGLCNLLDETKHYVN